MHITNRIKSSLIVVLAIFIFGMGVSAIIYPTNDQSPPKHSTGNIRFPIPRSLQIEHDELQAGLVTSIQTGGKTGKAAQKISELLHAHFIKEGLYALPPLVILPQLANGEMNPEMAPYVRMIYQFKTELPQILEEHKEIVSELNNMISVAQQENKPEQIYLAKRLKLHAQMKEKILYPAVILIGEHLSPYFQQDHGTGNFYAKKSLLKK
jgi:hypothetical protein